MFDAEARRRMAVEAELGDWFVIVQNLAIALAHPLNRGGTRPVMAAFVRQLAETLRHEGVLTKVEERKLFDKARITETQAVCWAEPDVCPECQQPLVLQPKAVG